MLRRGRRVNRRRLFGALTYLYRHYSATGELLYVGISVNVFHRTASHEALSRWFKDVRRIEVENFPGRTEALEAEAAAIKSEQPKYNKMHVYKRLPKETVDDKKPQVRKRKRRKEASEETSDET